jgi:hypothetical protein
MPVLNGNFTKALADCWRKSMRPFIKNPVVSKVLFDFWRKISAICFKPAGDDVILFFILVSVVVMVCEVSFVLYETVPVMYIGEGV